MKKKDAVILFMVVLIDQISKFVAFNLQRDNIKVIEDFFYITKVKNTGAAWGSFSGQMWLFYIISVIAIYFLYKIYRESNQRSAYFSFAILLMLGGTLGNLIDRVFFNYVRDFLNFYIFTYDYPVFNVADIALVIGVFLVLIYIVKNPNEELIWENLFIKMKRAKG